MLFQASGLDKILPEEKETQLCTQEFPGEAGDDGGGVTQCIVYPKASAGCDSPAQSQTFQTEGCPMDSSHDSPLWRLLTRVLIYP